MLIRPLDMLLKALKHSEQSQNLGRIGFVVSYSACSLNVS